MDYTTIYGLRALNYAIGRVGYAPEATNFIVKNLLPNGGKVADIGSGTGLFSAELLRYGYDTFCVEPNADMRIHAEKGFAKYSTFHSVPASAENTTLPDHSIDLITTASSFHWFDVDAFREECRRILVPGAKVCILINARSYNNAFTQRQHALCKECCPEFTSLCHGLSETEPKLDGFYQPGWHREEFDFPLIYTKERFIRRCLSSSYAPRPDSPMYMDYAHKLWEFVDEMCKEEKITVENSTVLFWGEV